MSLGFLLSGRFFKYVFGFLMQTTYAFTVMTPSYNRAATLPRVYKSLLQQNFTDFEWLIIDDGSSDNTAELVQGWIKEAKLPIRYKWQTNQHKKTAFNHGVREAQGQLLVALDSDDTILPDALAHMWQQWQAIPEQERAQYIAVTGLCARPDGQVVGDRFPQDVMSITSLDMSFKYRVRGEKFGCLQTSVLRQFPFPEDVKGFVPESLVWRKIARAGYKTRFVNHVYRTYFDSADSLSAEGARLGKQHALGLILLARDTVQDCLPWFFDQPKEFIKAAIRYTRFRLHLQDQQVALPELGRLTDWRAKALVLTLSPVGYLLYRRDKSN